MPDRVVCAAAFRIICDEYKSILKSSVTIFRHTLGIFRFEDIFIFNVHGSGSVRTITRQMVQILLLEYGGSHLSHYDLILCYHWLISIHGAYDQLSSGDIDDLESNRITYLNTLTTSSCHAYGMIPTSSGSLVA